jgi:hypothetical protein
MPSKICSRLEVHQYQTCRISGFGPKSSISSILRYIIHPELLKIAVIEMHGIHQQFLTTYGIRVTNFLNHENLTIINPNIRSTQTLRVGNLSKNSHDDYNILQASTPTLPKIKP